MKGVNRRIEVKEMKKIWILFLAVIFLASASGFSQTDPHKSKFYAKKMSGKSNQPRPNFVLKYTSRPGKPNPWDKYKKRRR